MRLGLLACAILLCAAAPSATRVYKMCAMEDDACVPSLRAAYRAVMQSPAAYRVCPRGHVLSDGQIVATYMQMGAENYEIMVGHSAVEFEGYVLSFALPCGY